MMSNEAKERLKRETQQEERSKGIEIRIADDFAIIKPTVVWARPREERGPFYNDPRPWWG